MNLTDNLFAGKLVRLAAPNPGDHLIMAKWSENTEFNRMGDFQASPLRGAEGWKDFDEMMKKRDNAFSFRIRTLSDDKLIGFLVLNISWSNQVAQVGIGIGEPDYWGHGYGSDAMRLAVDYSFRELGMYKVTLGVFSYNPRAIRAYEKVGFVHESRQRAVLYHDGQRFDMLEMGILRPEWEARLNQQES